MNLILEYVPETVYRVARHYAKQRQIIPILYIKIYMYQLFRALAYIHSECTWVGELTIPLGLQASASATVILSRRICC